MTPLQRLDALAGDWRWRAHAGEETLAGGPSAFTWIEDGAFLLHRSDAEDIPPEWVGHAPFPTTSVIALDDHSGAFTYAYADGRGVRRVYAMQLGDGRWDMQGRPGREFFQRWLATVDANAVRGRWEQSSDGEAWELDFEVTYTRVTDP